MGGTESMQDIGPDMDDLLRRAAEGYPLREPADDWDKIASRLPAATSPVAVPEKPRNKKRFLWLLLLLIPASVALYYGIPHSGAGNNYNEQQTTPGKLLNKTGVAAKEQVASSSTAETPVAPGNAMSDASDAIQRNDASNNVSDHLKTNGTDENNTASSKTPIAFNTNSNNESDPSANVSIHQPLVLLSGEEHETASNISSFNMQQLYGVDEVNKNEVIEQSNTLPVATAIQVNNTIFDSSETAPTTRQRIYHRKLYYGAIAGVGFSSVKSYGLKKAGYDAGLIAGYHFTKNIAVEAGVLATQKYYMSRGNDFNTNNLDGMMQPGMEMMEVEGSSQGISIPLHVKLDLNTKKGNKVFAKTGFSSLIMTKESNFYHTMMNGSPEMLKGTYTNNKNYFAASIDIAAGYEQNIKGKLYLRIEPYIQIPIKHVGVGDLPVTSAGLHVGISWPSQ